MERTVYQPTSFVLTYVATRGGRKVEERVSGLDAATKRAQAIVKEREARGNVTAWYGPEEDDEAGIMAFVIEG
jgi:uncharacterized membrane protein